MQPWPRQVVTASNLPPTGLATPSPTVAATYTSSNGDPFSVPTSPVLIVTVVVAIVVGLLVLLSLIWLCRGRRLRILRREIERAAPARPRKKKRVLGQKPVMDTVWVQDAHRDEKAHWKSILPISASYMPSITLTADNITDPPPPPTPDVKPHITTTDPLLQVSVFIAMPSPEPSQLGRKPLVPDTPKDPDVDSEWEVDPSIPELVLGVSDIEMGWLPEPNEDPSANPTLTTRGP